MHQKFFLAALAAQSSLGSPNNSLNSSSQLSAFPEGSRVLQYSGPMPDGIKLYELASEELPKIAGIDEGNPAGSVLQKRMRDGQNFANRILYKGFSVVVDNAWALTYASSWIFPTTSDGRGWLAALIADAFRDFVELGLTHRQLAGGWTVEVLPVQAMRPNELAWDLVFDLFWTAISDGNYWTVGQNGVQFDVWNADHTARWFYMRLFPTNAGILQKEQYEH